MPQQADESIGSVETHSAELYKAEKDSLHELNAAAEAYTHAEEGPESDLVSDEGGYDDSGFEEAEARLDTAGESFDVAKKRSDEFTQEHLDELHEAAIKEAAQRVANVYADEAKDA